MTDTLKIDKDTPISNKKDDILRRKEEISLVGRRNKILSSAIKRIYSNAEFFGLTKETTSEALIKKMKKDSIERETLRED
jgi:hypothetical protein